MPCRSYFCICTATFFRFFELRTILIIKAAGLYCSTYYLNNYISNSVAGKYALWVAQYNYRCTYTANKYGIWQYSSEGRINGISGNVDMDYCYTDYPAIVKNCGYNGYKKTTAKKTTAPGMFPLTKLGVYKITFFPDVCHNRSIAHEFLVGKRYTFFFSCWNYPSV